MKAIKSSIILSALLLGLCAFAYPLLIAAIGKLSPGRGEGEAITRNGKVVGFENVGQLFNQDQYFYSRPSAVDYNGAASGGSNKGPSDKVYLLEVETRIDTFLVHNPEVKRENIPSELVTASGSGLDPHISKKAAEIQVARISKIRYIEEAKLYELIEKHVEKPLWGIFGTEKINVLKLNLELDELNKDV